MSLEARDEAFPSTHWSVVAQAGDDDTTLRRRALAELVRRYLQPLRLHLQARRQFDSHRADDLLQGFLVSKVLEDDLFARAQREKGRFRTFVLTALDRFVSNQMRDERAQKRGGGVGHATLAPFDSNDGALADPDATTPDRAVEMAWAKQVLTEALHRMRQHCDETGRGDIWGVFEGRVLAATLGEKEVASYEQLVHQYGLESASQAMNLLATAKRMFGRALRSVIGNYECQPNDIEAELTDIRAILARDGSA